MSTFIYYTDSLTITLRPMKGTKEHPLLDTPSPPPTSQFHLWVHLLPGSILNTFLELFHFLTGHKVGQACPR